MGQDHCYNCGNDFDPDDSDDSDETWTHACYKDGCNNRVCDDCLSSELQDDFDESLVFCTKCAAAAAGVRTSISNF